MEQFDWVSDGSIRKFNRAIDVLRKEGKEATEAAIKELYVKWGGLLLGEAAPAKVEEEVADEPVAHPLHAKKGGK